MASITAVPPSEIVPSTTSPDPDNLPLTAATSQTIQMRYKLAPATFRAMSAIGKSPSRRDVLQKACCATEFRSFPIKQAEKVFFRGVNDHTAIPYPLTEEVSQPWQKAFLLVQIDLQRTGWPNKLSANARKELYQERGRIYSLLDRALRCLADILGLRHDGRGVTVALDVLRSVQSGVWEGNEMELLQVEGVGAVKLGRLVEAGVRTIKQLSRLDFFHIERLLSRNPPFGHQVLHQLAAFPKLTLRFEVLGQHTPYSVGRSSPPVSVHDQAALSTSRVPWTVRIVLGFENEKLPVWHKRHPWTTFVVEGEDERLVWFWRGSVKRLVHDKEMIALLYGKEGEKLKLSFACEDVVGTMLRETCCL